MLIQCHPNEVISESLRIRNEIISLPPIFHGLIRDNPYITSAKGLGGWGLEKWQYLLMFSPIYGDVELVGGSGIVQKCAGVI